MSFRLGLAMIAVGRATEAVFPLRKASDADEFAVPAGIVLASTLSQTMLSARRITSASISAFCGQLEPTAHTSVPSARSLPLNTGSLAVVAVMTMGRSSAASCGRSTGMT